MTSGYQELLTSEEYAAYGRCIVSFSHIERALNELLLCLRWGGQAKISEAEAIEIRNNLSFTIRKTPKELRKWLEPKYEKKEDLDWLINEIENCGRVRNFLCHGWVKRNEDEALEISFIRYLYQEEKDRFRADLLKIEKAKRNEKGVELDDQSIKKELLETNPNYRAISETLEAENIEDVLTWSKPLDELKKTYEENLRLLDVLMKNISAIKVQPEKTLFILPSEQHALFDNDAAGETY